MRSRPNGRSPLARTRPRVRMRTCTPTRRSYVRAPVRTFVHRSHVRAPVYACAALPSKRSLGRSTQAHAHVLPSERPFTASKRAVSCARAQRSRPNGRAPASRYAHAHELPQTALSPGARTRSRANECACAVLPSGRPFAASTHALPCAHAQRSRPNACSSRARTRSHVRMRTRSRLNARSPLGRTRMRSRSRPPARRPYVRAPAGVRADAGRTSSRSLG